METQPNNRTTSLDDLPDGLMENIFSRLPVKALIRSTAVNKPWYALINNPNFILSHINRSISNASDTHFGTHLLLLIPKIMSPPPLAYIISEENYAVVEKVEIPIEFRRCKNIKICGAVYGLLCLTDSDGMCEQYGRDLCLWNPSIRRYRTLDSSCFVDVDFDWTKHLVIGVGYHQGMSDYRIVRIVYLADFKLNFVGGKVPSVEVYSLREDRWREVKNYGGVSRVAGKMGSVFVDGRIYWLEERLLRCSETLWMISFDVDDEVFGEVKGPDNYKDWVGGEHVIVNLTEFRGSLCICAYLPPYVRSEEFCVWGMSIEDGTPSWSTVLKMACNDTVGWPLKLTRSGNVIIARAGKYGIPDLVSYDLNTREFQNVGDEGYMFLDTAFIESLVLFEEGKAWFEEGEVWSGTLAELIRSLSDGILNCLQK